jgi:hypothetical protein
VQVVGSSQTLIAKLTAVSCIAWLDGWRRIVPDMFWNSELLGSELAGRSKAVLEVIVGASICFEDVEVESNSCVVLDDEPAPAVLGLKSPHALLVRMCTAAVEWRYHLTRHKISCREPSVHAHAA